MSEDAGEKVYLLTDETAPRVVEGFGLGVATDRITVEGLPVRFMYREVPEFEGDSGWRFCSAIDEDEDYMADPDNLGVFAVNTIAALDRTIVMFLLGPVGSAFEKPPGTERFVAVEEE
jgi:hypothetical protein